MDWKCILHAECTYCEYMQWGARHREWWAGPGATLSTCPHSTVQWPQSRSLPGPDTWPRTWPVPLLTQFGGQSSVLLGPQCPPCPLTRATLHLHPQHNNTCTKHNKTIYEGSTYGLSAGMLAPHICTWCPWLVLPNKVVSWKRSDWGTTPWFLRMSTASATSSPFPTVVPSGVSIRVSTALVLIPKPFPTFTYYVKHMWSCTFACVSIENI